MAYIHPQSKIYEERDFVYLVHHCTASALIRAKYILGDKILVEWVKMKVTAKSAKQTNWG